MVFLLIQRFLQASQDPNREKKKKAKRGNKPGAQKGHDGSSLSPVANPDKFVKLLRALTPSFRQTVALSR